MAEVALKTLLPPVLNPQNSSLLPATKQTAEQPPRFEYHNVRSRSPLRMLYTSMQDAGPSRDECTYALELCTRRIEEESYGSYRSFGEGSRRKEVRGTRG